jgi:transcriptional regulator with XRE-family HTH domain
MKKVKDRRPQESGSPLETLRIERTSLSQAEFAVHCGIPLRTYQRWITGETEAKPSIPQLKKMCQILAIRSIDEIPDDFSPPGLFKGDRLHLTNH